MSVTPREFTSLLARARANDPDATRVLYEHYGEAILRVVRRYLDGRLRSIYDSTDFVQEVMLAAFQRAVQERTFATPDEFRKFLACVARNKVLDANRRHLDTQKGVLGHRCYLDDTPAKDNLASRHPSPAQVASAADDWERLLEGKNPFQRQVLELLRDGHTQREIAERLHAHEKTIGRFLQSLRGGRGPLTSWQRRSPER